MKAFQVADTHCIDYHYAVDAGWRKICVDQAIHHLRPLAHQFDAIAVRGMSGATVGAIIAHALGKDLILVRKPEVGPGSEESHTRRKVEGPLNRTPLARYLIVDDFEVTGTTITAIKERIGESAIYAGYYLYRDEELSLAGTSVPQPQPIPEPSAY